jgi:hypothetical protein
VGLVCRAFGVLIRSRELSLNFVYIARWFGSFFRGLGQQVLPICEYESKLGLRVSMD